MSKTTVVIYLFTGVLITYEDMPLHILFALPLVATLLELNVIKRKASSIIIYFVSSVIYGFGISSGAKHLLPSFYEGGLRVLSILITTTFGYVTIVYLLSLEVIQKLISYENIK